MGSRTSPAEVYAIQTLFHAWGREIRQQWRSTLFQLKLFFLILIILSAIGITFYRMALQWSLEDAVLQVVLTISTLGGDAGPHAAAMSPAEKWFKLGFIAAMTLNGLWGLSLLVQAMVNGDLVYYWGARRMEKRIAQMSDHYIICGFGRMGQEIARIFTRSNHPFVVIEHNPVQIPGLDAAGYLYVQGDEREDEQLLKAGIQRAKGLIAVAATDEDNVYISLSARVLNPDLYIVSRCVNASGEAKLHRAGANRVISPYIIGGRRMAQAILRPSVVEFLDSLIQGGPMELVIEEVAITADAPACGNMLQGDNDVEQLGVHLLGIATPAGQILMKGLNAHPLDPGDKIILLGAPEQMQMVIRHLTGMETAFEDEDVFA